MAKGQQKSNKETKKPKKDSSAPNKGVSPASLEAVRPTTVTTLVPKRKDKNKVDF